MFKEEYVRVSYRTCLCVGGGALAHVLPALPGWDVGGASLAVLFDSPTLMPSCWLGLSRCTVSLTGRGAGSTGGIAGVSCRHEQRQTTNTGIVMMRNENLVSTKIDSHMRIAACQPTTYARTKSHLSGQFVMV